MRPKTGPACQGAGPFLPSRTLFLFSGLTGSHSGRLKLEFVQPLFSPLDFNQKYTIILFLQIEKLNPHFKFNYCNCSIQKNSTFIF